MICYRDMTFCGYYRDCSKASECNRPLTDDVIAGCISWCGSSNGIAQWAERPDCHSKILQTPGRATLPDQCRAQEG